ncbi:uncharacterized protein LOC132758654, partial [Ruditapes philippinarum]|uniref:uncharacterized protein LOC132758654 n=1 Tax=Ruditapes philippinarum TaxID=129788 RepID=UPI00295C0460
NSEYSSWSAWKNCSADCGVGTRERTRHCILNDTRYCLRDDIGLQKCVGAGNCPGLDRRKTSFTNNQFLWNDLSYVIYNAWKQGEPTGGDCVRMNYQFYEPNNTWEAEDCLQTLADYFVCETAIENEADVSAISENNVRYQKYSSNDWKIVNEQIRTGDYRGTLNTSINGEDCLPWPPCCTKYKSIKGNFCRDPNGYGLLVCFTDTNQLSLCPFIRT